MGAWRKTARAWLAAAPLSLLAGCGGGGSGGAVNSTPPPTSSPPTSTSTTMAPGPAVNYDDAEYRRSNAAADIGAATAYAAGANGQGITLAIVDTGLTDPGAEFAGRISPASRGFGGNTGFADSDGHGTAVSAIAAAARNANDIEGVAWGATLMALRADTPDSCGSTKGCNFADSNLASAVDYARVNGAKVINFSLGGSAANGPLTAAIARAAAAGVIVVIAAGNDGTASPDAFAQVAATQGANGLVIIAGSHDASGAISSFSDRAGSFGQYYLTALGDQVRGFDQSGTAYLYSGTSFATPAIAAAAALLEQAFPNLTPAQVVDLLYRSATDAGAPGIDSVYGRGLLNIARAFQPIGTTSLAGSAVPVGTADAITLPSAMGDAALSPASLGRAIVLDSYGRAFSMSLGARTMRSGQTRPLRESLRSDLLVRTASLGGLAFSSTIEQRFADEPWRGLALKGRGISTERDRPNSGAIVSRIGSALVSGVAIGESASALARRLEDGTALAGSFLAARAPDQAAGFVRRADVGIASRVALGRLAIAADAERGRIDLADPADRARSAYSQMRAGLGRRLGPVRLAAYAGLLREGGTLFGARLSPALGRGGAVTRFLDLEGRLDLGRGWSAAGALRRGWTRGAGGGVLAGARLTSLAAALGVVRESADSRFGLRLAMPTRVTGGGLSLVVPAAYDYATGTVGYSDRFVRLAPHGQETDLEANAGLRLAGGWLESNLFWRRQPGNVATAPADLGGGVRYNLTF